MQLRERGIYTLPNGMVFVVREITPGYHILHSPLMMDERTKVIYGVDASGQIFMLHPNPSPGALKTLQIQVAQTLKPGLCWMMRSSFKLKAIT